MEKWKETSYLSIKYHLEQVEMQVASCRNQININRLDKEMLRGYIGELEWQLRGLKELLEEPEEQ